jgi:hypothetical protein
MGAADAPDDGEAQASAAAGPSPGRFLAPEAGEHGFPGLITHPRRRVLDYQSRPLALGLKAQTHLPWGIGVAQRIFQQVIEQLSNPHWVQGKGEVARARVEHEGKASVLKATLVAR